MESSPADLSAVTYLGPSHAPPGVWEGLGNAYTLFPLLSLHIRVLCWKTAATVQ